MGSRKGGFTLVELLTVMGIIAILASISSSVIKYTKDAVQAGVDIAHLKSIGSAAELYSTDYNGVSPRAVQPLLDQGYVTEKEATSPRDKFEDGWGNRITGELLRTVPCTSRCSYVSIDAYDPEGWANDWFMADAQGRGWLVNPSVAKSLETESESLGRVFPKSTYQRLGLDTSVQVKKVVLKYWRPDGHSTDIRGGLSLFIDEPDEWFSSKGWR